MAHRDCAECHAVGSLSGLIALAGILVALCGSGGHAIAGAILAVGFEVASVFNQWESHRNG